MIFVAIIRYKAPEADLAAHNAEHREYLRPFHESGKLVLAGPFVPRSGGLLLFDVADRAELDAILAGDPFNQRGYYDVEVEQWGPTLGAERLQALLAGR